MHEITPLESVEPLARGWCPIPLSDLVEQLMATRPTPDALCLVAVDGRSAGGKSSKQTGSYGSAPSTKRPNV